MLRVNNVWSVTVKRSAGFVCRKFKKWWRVVRSNLIFFSHDFFVGEVMCCFRAVPLLRGTNKSKKEREKKGEEELTGVKFTFMKQTAIPII